MSKTPHGHGHISVQQAVSAEDREHCFAVRRRVFVEDQGVAEADERDDLDARCTHWILRVDGIPAGTARMVCAGGKAKIQRVAIVPQYRGKGLGYRLVAQLLADTAGFPGVHTVVLSSQTHAVPFYTKLGFSLVDGREYLDAGIPHQDMSRSLPASQKNG